MCLDVLMHVKIGGKPRRCRDLSMENKEVCYWKHREVENVKLWGMGCNSRGFAVYFVKRTRIPLEPSNSNFPSMNKFFLNLL